MKAIYKAVAVGTIGALVMATTPNTARAEHCRDNDAAVAVVAGVAAVGIIAAIASSHHADVHVAYNYRAPAPPLRYEPPPQRFVPGHYEVRRERVVQPGHWEMVVEPAQYAWVRHGCRMEYVVVRPEIHRQVWVAERCDWVENQVWVPGHYEEGRYAYAR